MKRERDKILYVCSNCGYESAKWFGKCPQCGEWNTAVEMVGVQHSGTKSMEVEFQPSINDVPLPQRIHTKMHEMDRVLGRGLTPGSVVLVAGGPGIGKSTLLLEYASVLADKGKVYYVSGEESTPQVLARIKRLGVEKPALMVSSSVEVENVLASLKGKPIAVFFDSIQTLHVSGMNSLAGSVSQMRECTAKIVEYAKRSGTAVFLVGHVTKLGNIAGPMVLEHMVDTVLYLEGESRSDRRILRAIKNRFGPTDEMAVYEMEENGMREVPDPSRIFADMECEAPGNALSVVVEGSRSLVINVQALVTPNYHSGTVRVSRGFENSRLYTLGALTSNYLGVALENRDLYLSVLGGLKISDPAVDLAIVAALYSSAKKIRIPPTVAFVAEVGLDGRLRAVPRMKMRVAEAKRMGIKNVIASSLSKEEGVLKVKNVQEALRMALAIGGKR